MGATQIDDCNTAECPTAPETLGDAVSCHACTVCNRNIYDCTSTVGKSDWRRILPRGSDCPDMNRGDNVIILDGPYEQFPAQIDDIVRADHAARIFLAIFGFHVPFWISLHSLDRMDTEP